MMKLTLESSQSLCDIMDMNPYFNWKKKCSMIYWILLPKAEEGFIELNQCQVNNSWLEATYYIYPWVTLVNYLNFWMLLTRELLLKRVKDFIQRPLSWQTSLFQVLVDISVSLDNFAYFWLPNRCRVKLSITWNFKYSW